MSKKLEEYNNLGALPILLNAQQMEHRPNPVVCVTHRHTQTHTETMCYLASVGYEKHGLSEMTFALFQQFSNRNEFYTVFT